MNMPFMIQLRREKDGETLAIKPRQIRVFRQGILIVKATLAI